MRVRTLQSLTTPRGEISAGRVIDIPDHLAERLKGKVEPIAKEKPEVLLKTGRVVPIILENLTKTFQGLFEKAVDETAAVCRPGCFEMVQKDFLDLAKEIQDAEDRINLEWLKANDGAGDLGDFHEAVTRWRSLHLKAIGECQNYKQPSLTAACSKENQ